MMNTVEASLFLIHSLYDPPRRLRNVRSLHHDFLSVSELLPFASCVHIHWTELPLLEWVMDSAQES